MDRTGSMLVTGAYSLANPVHTFLMVAGGVLAVGLFIGGVEALVPLGDKPDLVDAARD